MDFAHPDLFDTLDGEINKASQMVQLVGALDRTCHFFSLSLKL
ncbi:hypothetical protein [Azospirillum doebereinerae]